MRKKLSEYIHTKLDMLNLRKEIPVQREDAYKLFGQEEAYNDHNIYDS
jgi:hypothetical protein